jgi:hypothetical protein
LPPTLRSIEDVSASNFFWENANTQEIEAPLSLINSCTAIGERVLYCCGNFWVKNIHSMNEIVCPSIL